MGFVPLPEGVPNTLENRFLDKITIDPETGCWLWRGVTGGGYGNFFFEKKHRRAHRFSYQAFYGQISKGLDLDHVCRVRRCVNPTHLRMVTERENVLIGNTIVAANLMKTHCCRGHKLSGSNLIRVPTGRACRECSRMHGRNFKRRKYGRSPRNYTHCKHGHELVIVSKGKRGCRICINARRRKPKGALKFI